MSNKFYDLIMD